MRTFRLTRRPGVPAVAVLLLSAAAAAAQPAPVPPADPPGQLPPVSPMPTTPGSPTVGPAAPPGPSTSAPNNPAPPTSDSAKPNAPQPDKPKWDFRWANPGLFIESANKDYAAHVGGTVHYDSAWYQASPLLELPLVRGGTGRFVDGTNLRRARIFLEGTLYQSVDYKFEMEFANGFFARSAGTAGGVLDVTNSPGPTDAWITVKDVPVLGNVRIGSQKEWFSLEHLNNYRALEFMERSYLFDFSQQTAFNNGFSPGVSAFRTWADDRVFSAVGFYKNESDLIGVGLGFGQYAVTGRLGALPVWEPEEHAFWYFGGAMSHRDPVEGRVQIRIRDNVRNAPFPLLPLLANTGPLPTGTQDLFNLETAAVYGPLTVQAEYTATVLQDVVVGRLPGGVSVPAGADFVLPPGLTGLQPGQTLFFQGCYAQALWLLTGESRTFNNKTYVMNRVVPKRPVRFKPTDGEGCGYGAWEVGVRYTYVDLSNRDVQAGRLDSVTVGLNWYLNAAAKLQFNYDLTHRGDTANPAQGTVHAFGTRLAFDF